MTVLLIVLGFGVVARVCRFIQADSLAEPFRVWVLGRFGGLSKLATLIDCPWCLSIWIGLPVAVVVGLIGAWSVPTWAVVVGCWLSWSYAYGMVSQLDG